MGAFILAWLTGEAIICYRSVKVQGGPPWPGQLMAGAGAFAALAVLAEAGPGARRIALTVAWGLNAAGFMALYQAGVTTGGSGWANTITGTSPASAGWWSVVTGNTISDTSVLPGSGGCGGSSSSSSSSTSGTAGSSPGDQLRSGEQSAQSQTYPGGCPAGQMRMPDGSCVKLAGM